MYEAFINSDSPGLQYQGELRIKNLWSNTYLNANGNDPGSDVSLHPIRPAWYSQRWNLEPGPDWTYRLSSSWGDNYLNNSADYNGAPVNVLAYDANYWSEMWFIEPTQNGLFRIKILVPVIAPKYGSFEA